MCKKLIVLALSLCLISSAGAETVKWDFENGNTHKFNLQSTYLPALAFDDPNIAGDELMTGVGGSKGLPDAGIAWTVGPPNQFDGQAPAVEEGCHVVDGVLQYGPCNDPFSHDANGVNARGQSSYLNTYNLSQWGDNLHSASNDQMATSPVAILQENAVLTVWSHGGGSGTHAPEYDPDPVMWYTDGSSGIAVLSAEEDDKYAILVTLHLNGQGTLTEDTLDLSAFAGRKVFIEVVDAFAGSWGWLAVDEIQITNATSHNAMIVVGNASLSAGFDRAQHDRLVSLGYTVSVVESREITDGSVTIDDCNGFDLLIISESILSDDADSLIGTTTPIMHNESHGWDNWLFTAPGPGGWQGGSEVNIVNDTHPIVVDANVSMGPMQFFDPQGEWTTELVSALAPGALSIAEMTPDGQTDAYAIIFAIEEGAELADGTPATARAVGFSLPGQTQMDPNLMTEEALALFDAAIAWLDPVPTSIPAMVAHWPMDDGAGTVVTDVVGGNDGTMVGLDPAAAWIADGALDGAVSFDGIDGHNIVVPDSNELDFGDEDFSISLMVRYPSIPTTEHRLVSKGTFGSPGTGSRYELYIKGSELRFEIDNGPANAKSSLKVANAPLVTGEWIHVVAIRDAVNDLMLVYADGVLLGTAADTSGDISNGEGMRIGASTNDDSTMTGDIDDVRIFDVALTEDEIAAIASQ